MELKELGDYQILKQVGQGSLGNVYLAEHRFMKKPFALKVLPNELSSDRNFIQRFEEEVGILSSLDHPHIVKLHNISFAEGNYFLVTDCIVDAMGETTNLAQYLRSRGERLPESEFIEILTQIASALDYAHRKNKGIAHRGLKPNNILIGKGEGGAHVYLSDYGLSRIVGSGAVLTRTFQMVAEAHGVKGDGYTSLPNDTESLQPLVTSFLQNYQFLAPEQKGFSANSTGVAVDIYAFGVLVYYMIAGHYPEGVFGRPSQIATEYKSDWDRLVSSCLHYDPDKRPQLLEPLLKEVIQGKKQTKQVSTPTVSQVSTVGDLKPVIHHSELKRPEVDPDPAAIFKIDTTVKNYVPEQTEEKNIEPMQTEMVVVKGGTFWRGSHDGNRDEKPYHQVSISSFAIEVHPMTNEQFVRFLEVMGGVKDNNHNDIIRLRDSRIKRIAGKFTIESGYGKHPVVGVTWYGAAAYAKWIGKRLPTEAEWEIAACGGDEGALYPTGEDIEKTQANFFSSDTTAVKSYSPNNYGLYDMAGNVYEWCQDWYGYNYYDASIQEPNNPQGPLQGEYRVLRGGCWKSLKEDLRCSRRHRNNPGTVNGTYGFRCAADVQ